MCIRDRSGSLQKLAKKADTISINIPSVGAIPNNGSTNHPTSMNPLPINAGVITGKSPPLAISAKSNTYWLPCESLVFLQTTSGSLSLLDSPSDSEDSSSLVSTVDSSTASSAGASLDT